MNCPFEFSGSDINRKFAEVSDKHQTTNAANRSSKDQSLVDDYLRRLKPSPPGKNNAMNEMDPTLSEAFSNSQPHSQYTLSVPPSPSASHLGQANKNNNANASAFVLFFVLIF